MNVCISLLTVCGYVLLLHVQYVCIPLHKYTHAFVHMVLFLCVPAWMPSVVSYACLCMSIYSMRKSLHVFCVCLGDDVNSSASTKNSVVVVCSTYTDFSTFFFFYMVLCSQVKCFSFRKNENKVYLLYDMQFRWLRHFCRITL